mgnify:CR=1 FL=1
MTAKEGIADYIKITLLKWKIEVIRKKYKTDVSDSNWYKNAGIIYDLMVNKYFIPKELLEKYFVYHFIDCLELEDQLIIINELYKNSVNEISETKTADGKITVSKQIFFEICLFLDPVV